MKLATAKQMQEIDRAAIATRKIPSLDLMENAGRRVTNIIKKEVDPSDPILIVVGKGNNGGDGLVVARLLIESGLKVEVAITVPPERLSRDASINWKRLGGLKPKITEVYDEASILKLREAVARSKYIVDAIFGTGLSTEIGGRYLKIIECINNSHKPVVAVDIPSGLSADTGKPLGMAVKARITVTFGLPKLGLILPPGPEYAKRVFVTDIGFPKDLIDSFKTQYHISTPDLFKKYFTPREQDSHKGSFGHVLVLAGSVGKMGAGWLTSKTALRSGTGLVTYGIPDAAFSRFDTRFAEVMTEPIYDKKRGRFIPESISSIKEACKGKNAVALGPGIGTHKETEALVCELIAKLKLPLIIDADGLNNMKDHLGLLKKRSADTVLTPHPGEMGRLINKDIKSVQASRITYAKDFATRHGVYLVLKGNKTIVATQQGGIYINPTGNPSMATAGTGDALTGMIAAFIAQKIPTLDATIAAVYIHGLAGDLAGSKTGEIGMITSDLIENIPEAIKIVKQWEGTEGII